MRRLLLIGVLALLAWAGPANAATIFVTETADSAVADGDCSLREALRAANLDLAGVDSCQQGAGADTVVVPPGYYRLSLAGSDDTGSAGDLDLTESVTIRGAGAIDTVVDAKSIDRVFQVISGTVAIRGLTIRGGQSPPGTDGGGIQNAGTLTLTNVVVTGNAAGESGGGIYNIGTLSIANSTIGANSAPFSPGGGIYSHDTATFAIQGSLVYGNSSSSSGGGLYSQNVVAARTTFAGNTAASHGGGLYAPGPVRLTDVTVSGNQSSQGGGIWVANDVGEAASVLKRVVVTRNASTGPGGGIYNFGGLTGSDVTISRNSATDGGGGMDNEATLLLSRSVIFANTAAGGDGLLSGAGGATLTNVTISGNGNLSGQGGGIYNFTGTANLINVTLAENSANASGGSGGNIFNSGGTVNAKDTISATDFGGGECAGTAPVDQGHNLAFDDVGASCGFPQPDSTTPLGPLANNGGPTPTRALRPGSAAVNGGSGCPGADQRGVPRPQGAKCDIGAYELARCLGGIVNRVGTPGADRMTGGSSAEVFLTLGGADVVSPGGGPDRVCAGAGNDTVKIRGGGKDRADGGPGRDRVQKDASDVVQAFEVFF